MLSTTKFVENILSTKTCALIEITTEFVENILSTKICALIGSIKEFVENILSTVAGAEAPATLPAVSCATLDL